jgi:hypothetical protein
MNHQQQPQKPRKLTTEEKNAEILSDMLQTGDLDLEVLTKFIFQNRCDLKKDLYITFVFWNKNAENMDSNKFIELLAFLKSRGAKYSQHIYFETLHHTKKVQEWVLDNLNYIEHTENYIQDTKTY